jgi:putative ABC transport system permease protein
MTIPHVAQVSGKNWRSTLPASQESRRWGRTGQHRDRPFHIPGRSYGPSEFDDAYFRQVTPGYLMAMRIPLLAGRWLNRCDTANRPGTILVNQAFAKHFFLNSDVVGKHQQLMGDLQPTREIVGIVGNIRHTALSAPVQPEMYVAYAQYAPPTMNLVGRATGNPDSLRKTIYGAVRAIEKDETLSALQFRTLLGNRMDVP